MIIGLNTQDDLYTSQVCYNDAGNAEEQVYFGDYHSLWSNKRPGMQDDPITFALASTNVGSAFGNVTKIPIFTVSFTGEDDGQLATALKTMLTLNPALTIAARNIYIRKFLYVDTTMGVPKIKSCTKVACTETGTEITLGDEQQGMDLIKEAHIQFGDYSLGNVVVVLRNQSGTTYICSSDGIVKFVPLTQTIYDSEVQRCHTNWSSNKIASDVRIQQGGTVYEGLVNVLNAYYRAQVATPPTAVIL